MKNLGLVLKRSALGMCVAFILIQFIPVNRINPPVEADVSAPPDVGSVLRRACYDCHSSETRWPWYSHVAPVSWVIAHDVHEGRATLNYSTWNRLSPEKQAEAIQESWEEGSRGQNADLVLFASASRGTIVRKRSISAAGVVRFCSNKE